MTTEENVSQEQRNSREISNDNLIPFKPGQSGNPGGKVAGKSITAELRKLIDKGTNAEDLARVLYDMAKTKLGRDQLAALRELLNRTDGPVTEKHEVVVDTPRPLIFKECRTREDVENFYNEDYWREKPKEDKDATKQGEE